MRVIISGAVSFLLACLAATVAAGGGILHIPSAADLARAHCPSRCGGVAIYYPFGIGPGCFRQGFELTCDNNASPPRLFLGNSTSEILALYPGENGIYVPAIHFNATMKPGMDATDNMLWEAPVKGVMVTGGSSSLYLVGCSVGVYLFGHDTNNPIGSCMSICLDNKEAMEEANPDQDTDSDVDVGMGSCFIRLKQDVRAFGFIVGRLNGGVSTLSGQGQGLSDSIKVFLADGYNFHPTDIYSSQIDEKNVKGVSFRMAITDQPSCESAQKNKSTYPCSDNSDCQDLSSGGYSCWCRSYGEDDNPYIMDGCQANYSPNPKRGCKRLCGNTSIPFPFGLEKGCYAVEKFRLNCTSENITIFDRRAKYIVANISVNEGYLSVRETQNSRYGDEELTVIVNTGKTSWELGDFFLDGFYLSEEYDMKMWWFVDNLTCPIAMSKQRSAKYACRSVNSTCVIVTHGYMNGSRQLGYRCQCSQGFDGNPYIADGCTGKHTTISSTKFHPTAFMIFLVHEMILPKH